MAEQVKGHPLAQRAENIIRRVQGVSAVRVDLAPGGAIGQVHVLAAEERSARMVAGDVISALAAELEVVLDQSQVRVAIRRSDRGDAGQAPLRPRLKFVGMSVTTLRTSAEVKIQLEHEGKTCEGMAAGPNAGTHRLHLVGEATLRAVETHLRAQGVFLLEGATIASLGERQVALVLVAWLGPDEGVLSGSSPVHDDPREAVVRAVLDAVNRPVAWLGHR